MENIKGNHITSQDRMDYDPNTHALMEVMDGSGDTKSIWDPENEAEVAAAEAQYNVLIKKGYRAFAVTGEDGEQGEQMDKFDPKAGRMIMIPALKGG